jgi:hypothetical protein
MTMDTTTPTRDDLAFAAAALRELADERTGRGDGDAAEQDAAAQLHEVAARLDGAAAGIPQLTRWTLEADDDHACTVYVPNTYDAEQLLAGVVARGTISRAYGA